MAVILAFVLGFGVGALYMRFRATSSGGPESNGSETAAAPLRVSAERPPAPNRRGRKVGLTEADFTPSDDILERLRLVEAGELDPAALQTDEGEPAAAAASPEPPAPATLDPAAMTDAERRVLDRLRRLSGEEPADD